MATNLQEISAVLSSILGILGFFLLGYVLLMGWAYQGGRNKWFEKIIGKFGQEQKPIIKLLSNSTKGELPWQDPTLIHGGLTALRVIVILLGYVIVMSIFVSLEEETTTEELIKSISIFMSYPIVMTSFYIAMLVILYSFVQKIFRPWEFIVSLLWLIIISSIAAFLSYNMINSFEQTAPLLTSQLLLLIVVSMCISYLYGVIESFKDANIEARFPLVEVVTLHGKIDRLHLYEKTDSDYRFIGEDGVNHIIPTVTIIAIKHYSIFKDSEGNSTAHNTDEVLNTSKTN